MAYIHVEPKEKTYAHVYRIFSGNPMGRTFNIQNMFPDVDCSQLTSEDFICTYKSDLSISWGDIGMGNEHNCSARVFGLSMTPSYNPNTGILSISPASASGCFFDVPGYYGAPPVSGLNCTIYVIIGGIREDYV